MRISAVGFTQTLLSRGRRIPSGEMQVAATVDKKIARGTLGEVDPTYS